MYLHVGGMIGAIAKLREDSIWQIKTSLGTAGVRGTTYYVGFCDLPAERTCSTLHAVLTFYLPCLKKPKLLKV